MRSRQHVVIARLNDKEYAIYQRVLRRALRQKPMLVTKNQSHAFRLALMQIDELLTEYARMHFYDSLEFPKPL